MGSELSKNNKISEALEVELPESVQLALQQALKTLPEGENARVWRPSNEGALNHVLFIEVPTSRSVFRMRREASTQDIFDYLSSMYLHTGLYELGGIFRLRSIQEEVTFMRQAQAHGLPVPKLLQDGGNWILIEFIEGQTAYAAVKEGELSVVAKVVEALHDAHCQGVIYGDRWSDNEIINKHGQVRFIDFDVEWALVEPQTGLLEAMEIAVYLFNALRLTSNRSGMLELVRHELASQLCIWGYDMERLAKFARGISQFYLDPNKPSNEWSLPASLYLSLVEPAEQLVHYLRTA